MEEKEKMTKDYSLTCLLKQQLTRLNSFSPNPREVGLYLLKEREETEIDTDRERGVQSPVS